MYGSIFHLKVQPGREGAVRQLFERWDREHAPRVQGFHTAYLFKPDEQPDELIAVAIFADREAYRANASAPEQDRWYRELRALLTRIPFGKMGRSSTRQSERPRGTIPRLAEVVPTRDCLARCCA